MRLIDKKIEDEHYLGALGKATKKSPTEIKKQLGYKSNSFETKIKYLNWVNAIEDRKDDERYSICDLFVKQWED